MKIDANTIRGLTLWQPMAWAVACSTKRTENRPQRPWKWVTHLAIHAGLKWHEDHARQIRELLGIHVPDRRDPQIHHAAVIAVARLGGAIEGNFREALEDPWFSGPFGWKLEDVVALEPIACRGAQGLWRLPAPVFDEIQWQLARAA